MGIATNWHSELVVRDESDPFDEPLGERRRIENVGTPIAVGAEGEPARLHAELVQTLMAEGQLDAEGVTCAIKDARDTSCHACPLFLADGSPAAELCAIGRRQEALCTQIAVLHRGGRR